MKIIIQHDIPIEEGSLTDKVQKILKEHCVFMNHDKTLIKAQKCSYSSADSGELVLGALGEVCYNYVMEVSYLPCFVGDHLNIEIREPGK